MDERKKNMLMIGGVVALAVVVIIVAAVMMNHKKKIEQSPMIVQTTTGAIIVPATTRATTTVPIQKKNYIKSSDGNYLILEYNYKISSTSDYKQATPIVLGTLTYNNQLFYPLMTESGKYISMTNNYVNYTDIIDGNTNNATTLVLMSKTYPTDLYLWGTNYSIQPSLVVGTDSNNSFSVVYV